MAYETFPKKGKLSGYKRYKHSVVVATKEVDFYESQNLGLGAANPENTRMDLYAKPGTSTARRQPDPYSMRVSRPTSRYRSIRP